MLKKFNYPLLVIPSLIFLLGYLTLLSTAPDKASMHLVYFASGLLLYFAVTFVDYYFFRYYWKMLYVGIVLMLLLTFALGVVKFGSSSWLSLGLIVIQPSEFAKIVVIVSMAALITSARDSVNNPKSLIKLGLINVLLIALVLIQPDLGTALVIGAVFVGIVIFAGINKSYIVLIACLIGFFSSPLWQILREYQKRRVLVFLNPSLDVLGSGYNVIQSVISIGSGKLLGKGFGMGTQSHLGFLPVYWTDFIFAAFAEEWGFIGLLMFFALYLALFLLLIYIINAVKDTFGVLICVGVFVIFLTQFIINVGMNLGVMPVTGIPLSLVSHGGSSMITSLILLGLVQSVWVHRKE